jgi:hypothetical protein
VEHYAFDGVWVDVVVSRDSLILDEVNEIAVEVSIYGSVSG